MGPLSRKSSVNSLNGSKVSVSALYCFAVFVQIGYIIQFTLSAGSRAVVLWMVDGPAGVGITDFGGFVGFGLW